MQKVSQPSGLPELVNPPQVPSDGTNFKTPNKSVWGAYDINTDYTTFTPDTGVVREYTLNLTETSYFAPDGYNRTMQVFNGQYPGPLIKANWGDTIKITVNNNVQYNGSSVHWHGTSLPFSKADARFRTNQQHPLRRCRRNHAVS